MVLPIFSNIWRPFYLIRVARDDIAKKHVTRLERTISSPQRELFAALRRRDFVQTHDDAFGRPGAPDPTYFVGVIERAMAIILAREAMATIPAASNSH